MNMADFPNRLDKQRAVLRCINQVNWPVEQLASLATPAVKRWAQANHLREENELVVYVSRISEAFVQISSSSQSHLLDTESPMSHFTENMIGHLSMLVEEFVRHRNRGAF
jgi:hypothetical protein